MLELPTFYGWILRIGGVAVVIGLCYLYNYAELKHPLLAKYVIMPLAMIMGFITLTIFIITQ